MTIDVDLLLAAWHRTFCDVSAAERALIRAGPRDARDAEDDAWASREPGDDQSPPRPEGETA